MTILELQQKLLDAYTIDNLNNISLTLINLYKNQQYSILQKIAEIISDFTIIEIKDDGKGFSKFMKLYHPDRLGYHINEIFRLTEQNNYDRLLEYSHILKLERIEEIANSLDSYEDIDYSPVYEWNINVDEFTIITENDQEEDIKINTKGYTFYDAIKLRVYGDIKNEYPPYYLEDLDEFELASSNINDLYGIQFCIHAKSIDLSDNQINDLISLFELTMLEELNLSDNHISIIDVLSNLTNLKIIHLSNNFIKDISALFDLENLEYVNLSGNKVSLFQINKLIQSGVIVDL
jgi:Leucine-rich repeat (LRR) protein